QHRQHEPEAAQAQLYNGFNPVPSLLMTNSCGYLSYPSTHPSKTRREPSGDHAGALATAPLPCLRFVAPEPSGLISQMSLPSESERPKASCEPSGDQAGEKPEP